MKLIEFIVCLLLQVILFIPLFRVGGGSDGE